MSRPIPEGVEAPDGAVILGYGGTFKVPDGQGVKWAWGVLCREWLDDEGLPWSGSDRGTLYAADAGSEVARLNEPLLAKFVRTHNEGTKPSVATEDIEEDPRDGAIRALVQKWREEADIRSNGNAAVAMTECADELEATLALAKQCGCCENSSS